MAVRRTASLRSPTPRPSTSSGGKNANYETWLRRLLRLGTRCRLYSPSRAAENPRLLGGAGGQLGLDLAGEKGFGRSLRPILCVREQPLCRHAADDHGTG